jgi:hypothetical protein
LSDPRTLQAANLAAALATIVFNGLVNALPLAGVTTGEVSAAYPSLFTPPGWVFSVWGLIYSALLVFSIYQVRPGQRSRPYLPRIGWLHVASAACNVAWLVVFHYSFERPGLAPFTLVPMYALFALLLAIYLRLPVGVEPVGRAEKLAVHLPFSLYLGWVTLATMANTAFVLNAVIPGIPLPVQRASTVVLLLAVLLVGLLILRNRRDLVFALVIVWAAGGIAIERTGYPEIAATAGLTAIVVAAAILLLPLARRQGFAVFYLREPRSG